MQISVFNLAIYCMHAADIYRYILYTSVSLVPLPLRYKIRLKITLQQRGKAIIIVIQFEATIPSHKKQSGHYDGHKTIFHCIRFSNRTVSTILLIAALYAISYTLRLELLLAKFNIRKLDSHKFSVKVSPVTWPLFGPSTTLF